jgi:cation transport regulator ChaC
MNPPSPTPDPAAELRAEFTLALTKLGTLAAALGLAADASTEAIKAAATRHIRAHAGLLGAAAEVLASAHPALNAYQVRAAALERLRAAVEVAHRRE